MAFWFIQWYLPSAQPPQPKGAGAVFPYVLPLCSYFFKSFVTEMSIFICMHKCLAQTGRLRGSSCHILVAAKRACACTLLWISDHFYKKLLPYVLFFFFKIYLKKIDVVRAWSKFFDEKKCIEKIYCVRLRLLLCWQDFSRRQYP